MHEYDWMCTCTGINNPSVGDIHGSILILLHWRCFYLGHGLAPTIHRLFSGMDQNWLMTPSSYSFCNLSVIYIYISPFPIVPFIPIWNDSVGFIYCIIMSMLNPAKWSFCNWLIIDFLWRLITWLNGGCRKQFSIYPCQICHGQQLDDIPIVGGWFIAIWNPR